MEVQPAKNSTRKIGDVTFSTAVRFNLDGEICMLLDNLTASRVDEVSVANLRNGLVTWYHHDTPVIVVKGRFVEDD